MATSLSQRIVSSKVDILMEQRGYLQTFVDETDKVLQMATSWLRNEDTTKSFTYSDMKKMIDDKLDFLDSTDFSVGFKEVTTEQATVAARSLSQASKSTDQPLPAGHVHVSGVTVASEEFKTILSQVNVMQEAMSSLSTGSKMFSEKQLAMEKAAIQQDQRMTNFEKKIQDVTVRQSHIFDQQRIKMFENNAATNTQMGALEGEIKSLKESLEELSIRLVVHGSSLEELSTIFEVHGSSLEGLSTKFEEHGSLFKELTRRNDETFKVLTSAQESELEKLQELEDKLSVLEKSWSETTMENGKLCQDVETKYEMVCQVVTDRLVPLERLRDIFNGNMDARTEHIKKLDNVCDQMADLLLKFSQVEQQTHAIGYFL